jgi:hypothetical protein
MRPWTRLQGWVTLLAGAYTMVIVVSQTVVRPFNRAPRHAFQH